MVRHVLDLGEVAILAVIGVALWIEHVRLRNHLARQPFVTSGPVGADVYTVTVAAALLVCAALYAATRARAWFAHEKPAEQIKGRKIWENLRRPAFLLACTVLYALLMPVLGYVLSSMAFFSVYSRLDSKRLAENAVYGIVFALGFYLLFELIIGMPLPKGTMPW